MGRLDSVSQVPLVGRSSLPGYRLESKNAPLAHSSKYWMKPNSLVPVLANQKREEAPEAVPRTRNAVAEQSTS